MTCYFLACKRQILQLDLALLKKWWHDRLIATATHALLVSSSTGVVSMF